MKGAFKSESLTDLKRELEAWIDFNSKSPLMVLDISKLISMMKRYYKMELKKMHQNKK